MIDNHTTEKTELRTRDILADDTGATTAEYAVTIVATYIASGRTYFTLAGVPVRTG